MIIGCGGVASVAIHKCCQNSEFFDEICIASRTKSKCDALKEKLEGTTYYQTKWFVRWTIIDKRTSKAIGTIEMFHRISDDPFNDMGVFRH